MSQGPSDWDEAAMPRGQRVQRPWVKNEFLSEEWKHWPSRGRGSGRAKADWGTCSRGLWRVVGRKTICSVLCFLTVPLGAG